MFTTVMLAMTLGAPVPPSVPAPPAGPAPRLEQLKANADGKILITVTRAEKVKMQAAVGIAIAPGGAAPPPPPPQPIVREITVNKAMTVELGDVKELTITTTDGKKLDVADALKRLKGGAVVLVSADGKPVSSQYLKLFKDDVLVLSSPELVALPRRNGRSTPGFTGQAVPLPPLQIQPLPARGGIQIQVQPGVQIVPLQPAVPPAPRK